MTAKPMIIALLEAVCMSHTTPAGAYETPNTETRFLENVDTGEPYQLTKMVFEEPHAVRGDHVKLNVIEREHPSSVSEALLSKTAARL